MNFCSSCGARVALRIPDGDHLQRQVCTACGTIHYENPKLVAGCVPEHDGQILLCRRAIEPRRGYWTIPAGFMENEETLQQAAARECWEEALARVEIGGLCAIVHVLHAHQVHVMFSATLAEPSYGVGVESLEVMLCTEAEIPWPEIAFPSVAFALGKYLEDRAAGTQGLHFTTIDMRLASR
jgi:ADP-ribose pyrophosphatase YjhB (NUDIX family)